MDQTSQATDSSVTDVATQQSRRYPSSAEVEAAFTSSYPRYQYSFVELFAEHVADVCRTFNGDMQMAVLLATVGQVTLRAALAAEAADEAIDRLPPERRGITAHRLADATGIPRETTRRKLVAMEKMGWLTREKNFWCLAFVGSDASARIDLAELDERTIKRVARFYAAVAPLVESD